MPSFYLYIRLTMVYIAFHTRQKSTFRELLLTSCRQAAAMICPAHLPARGRRSASRRRADGNVAAVTHGQHIPKPIAAAAWRANTAVSKAAWWLWLLNLKVVSESSVTWATSVPNLVFVGLSVLDKPDVRDRRQTAQHHRFMPPPIRGGS